MKNSLKVKTELNTLELIERGPRKRRSNPYLWVIHYKIDAESITVSERFKIMGQAKFHFTQGSLGNLGISALEGEGKINIPPHLGHWSAQLDDMPLPFFNYKVPAFLGIITVLMENNGVSEQGVEAGHKRFNEYIETQVNEQLAAFDVYELDVLDVENSLKAVMRRKAMAFETEVYRAVGSAVFKGQNILQNFKTLIDRDEMIGFEIWNFTSAELRKTDKPLAFSQLFKHPKYGQWEITGTVQVDQTTKA